MTVEITRELAQRVDEVVRAGLVRGVGKPTPGQMCVEAAVCYALGEPHGDEPSCVGSAVRAYKIRLNDANWSSNAARTAGLRALAIAQLGSDTIDQDEFRKRLAFATIHELLARFLRLRGYERHAVACEQATTLQEAKNAAADAYAAAAADAYAAAADAAAAAADDAAAAAYAYAYAAYAAAAAAAADDAYAAAAAADDAYAAAAAAAANSFLQQSAAIAVRVLIELGSPGTKWLGILEDVA